MQQLAERVKGLAQSDSEIVNVPYSEAYAPGFEDMERRVPSTRKIEALLGWTPTRTLDQILKNLLALEAGRLAAKDEGQGEE